MKKRFTEEKIIQVLKEQEAVKRIVDVCRCHRISQPASFRWKSRFAGMEISDARKLKWVQETGIDWHYIQPGKPTRKMRLLRASTDGRETRV